GRPASGRAAPPLVPRARGRPHHGPRRPPTASLAGVHGRRRVVCKPALPDKGSRRGREHRHGRRSLSASNGSTGRSGEGVPGSVVLLASSSPWGGLPASNGSTGRSGEGVPGSVVRPVSSPSPALADRGAAAGGEGAAPEGSTASPLGPGTKGNAGP